MSILHDVTLVFSPGWSHALAREIIHIFPDRSFLFTASSEMLHARLPRFSRWIRNFLSWRTSQCSEEILAQVEAQHITCIGYDDEHYPTLLKYIHEPPLVLFVQGNIPPSVAWCGIVGSRHATAYGTTQAFRFGKEVAEQGIGIVSGLAYGVDEYAIRGACSVGGSVIAVLAGGHEALGLREQELRTCILKSKGAVISEKAPHIRPNDYAFPIRNRIIAGIAERVLVVEGEIKSGSLITAREALRENREVFALPGQITSPMSSGCHILLKEGAGLCTSVYDLLNIQPPSLEDPHYEDSSPQKPLPYPSTTIPTPFHKTLWEFLHTPQTFDSLVEYAREKRSEVAGILNIWEIERYVALKNGYYHQVPYEHPSHC